ncbi:MAG: SAM-dependent methyltransferase [Cereibacter sphaeroides]|uniref:SAM-dependent methyltransferase n=1 Tax=Cereibacter sphaeroides TaxID=1063 RepID=A0A2W5S1M9_CERSP|nr:MAG: SAM-dependent methyltransferase [Cereibacter sphaeroides]
MKSSDVVFAGSVPEMYDKLAVPMIFDPYAADMAERVAALRPRRVLETAAGTGAVTRAMLVALPQDAEIVATDLNPGMIERGRVRANDPRVVWQQADALALPFRDGGFDVVVCQFGMMFFPDKPKGYAEARRVLRPGGHFLFNVWDLIEANPLALTAVNALAEIFPQSPPEFARRTPHGHHNPDLIRSQLEGVGFSQIEITSVRKIARVLSAMDAATSYCQGTPMRGEIEERGGDVAEITARVAEAMEARFGTGRIEAPVRASVVVAS